MPGQVVMRLNTEINKLLQKGDVKERLLSQGATPIGSTPEQLADFIKTEIAKWSEVVKFAGVRLD